MDVGDGIQLFLTAGVALSAVVVCFKTVTHRVPIRASNVSATTHDIEASLLDHIGASEEDVHLASITETHPNRRALRVLYPLHILVSSVMAVGSLALLGASLLSARVDTAGAQAALALGWVSQAVAVVKAREALVHDVGAALLSAEIRGWTVVALLYYVIQCVLAVGAGYHIDFVVVYAVGGAACVANVLLEVLAVSAGDEHGSGPDGGRRREKSWVLLLGAAITYVWPDSLYLRMRAVICLVLVVLIRILNLAVPFAYKKVIDSFSLADATGGISFGQLAYPWVVFYLTCSLFQGGTGGGTVGLISNLRQYLWIPISQAAYKRLSLDIFAHVLSLDHNFHLHRKTGELLRIMDRGTVSVQTLLSTVMFQIGPAMFDIVAAALFLAIRMQLWIAVIVFISLGVYMPMTIYVTEYRGKYRRELNKMDNARSARATDALLNYETIKIFGNERLETTNYRKAIQDYQSIDFKLIASMNALNVMQSLVIFSGVASGLMICTYGVAQGTLSVGDTVLFVSMMQQLYAPLNFFGTYYRMLQTAALDMEGVFKLLETEPSIKDGEGAADFEDSGKELDIVFRDVRFQYTDQGEALKGISFVAAGGKTTSLVGSTGSGKSTILRLLVRFYDPTSGSVSIGGQPLSAITLASLRKTISVVPQDTVLLNDTIWYNIKYGNPNATDEEVIEAAKGACLFDTIMTRFPDGFDTLVGERGLRLSGGEKQRVAFARAILRNPPVLILDEATSALDSITEDSLWQTLAQKKQNRTVVIVAHRLSTVVDSDKIIVVNHGEIAEEGTHDQLLRIPNGLYAQMWTKQSQAGNSNATVEELMTTGQDDQKKDPSPEQYQ
jgi:ATP-binding cassette subfamily B (MDR/TAP) protein 6